MFRCTELHKRARREGGEELCQRLQEKTCYKRIEAEDRLLLLWGRAVKTWPYFERNLSKRMTRSPLSVLTLNKYPFSDQHALFSKFTSDLLAHLSPSSIIYKPLNGVEARFTRAGTFFREGTTRFQRFLMPSIIVLRELLLPVGCVIFLVAAQFVHFFVLLGLRFPVLWFFSFNVSGAGINGREVLAPGENGYTKLFKGGEDVDITDLETELMTRNSESSSTLRGGTTVAISYKHYANNGKALGDDKRICRTDLQAIARLIKEAAPCNIRFWIDAKLPVTDDDSFERWINRGVRPYGRYITFICPSAIEHAHTSFWLANEYHFAAAAKGVIHPERDQFFYELRYGYNLDLYRRFLQVIIGAEGSPVQVRDQDKGKVVHWAMCCLRASRQSVFGGHMSPCIDNLTMIGKYSHDFILLRRITSVIQKFGPQELPVVPGRSWNADNPLLMGDAPQLDFNLSDWYGFCLDGSPMTIYFIHRSHHVEICCPTLLVLEVTLDKPHFSPGKIHVRRKVLRELESSILLDCKVVTLPWLCDWV